MNTESQTAETPAALCPAEFEPTGTDREIAELLGVTPATLRNEMDAAAIARSIALEPDVRRVVEIEKIDDRFRFLIETPFETFPRFVIGTVDETLEDIQILLRCGDEQNATAEWKKGLGR